MTIILKDFLKNMEKHIEDKKRVILKSCIFYCGIMKEDKAEDNRRILCDGGFIRKCYEEFLIYLDSYALPTVVQRTPSNSNISDCCCCVCNKDLECNKYYYLHGCLA